MNAKNVAKAFGGTIVDDKLIIPVFKDDDNSSSLRVDDKAAFSSMLASTRKEVNEISQSDVSTDNPVDKLCRESDMFDFYRSRFLRTELDRVTNS